MHHVNSVDVMVVTQVICLEMLGTFEQSFPIGFIQELTHVLSQWNRAYSGNIDFH